jgi:hypothetical protein
MTQNVLGTSLKTCHWGYFDATLPPAMTISSGDEVGDQYRLWWTPKPTGPWVPCATRIAGPSRRRAAYNARAYLNWTGCGARRDARRCFAD